MCFRVGEGILEGVPGVIDDIVQGNLRFEIKICSVPLLPP